MNYYLIELLCADLRSYLPFSILFYFNLLIHMKMKIHCSNILNRSIYDSSLFLRAHKPRTGNTAARYGLPGIHLDSRCRELVDGRGINWPSLDLILIFHPVPVAPCNNHRFSPPSIEMQRVM